MSLEMPELEGEEYRTLKLLQDLAADREGGGAVTGLQYDSALLAGTKFAEWWIAALNRAVKAERRLAELEQGQGLLGSAEGREGSADF